MQSGRETALVIGWLGAAFLGLGCLATYEFEPGDPGVVPTRWPSPSQVDRDPVRPTVVMFAHPRCPCTRASLGELSKIAARANDRAAFRVLFYEPEGAGPDWAQTDLWRSAAQIPGCRVVLDRGGQEAARFDLRTSGHVVVYDASGQLRYSGGVTGSRGHHGDNALASAVDQLLRDGSASLDAGPVFGCALTDRDCERTSGSQP